MKNDTYQTVDSIIEKLTLDAINDAILNNGTSSQLMACLMLYKEFKAKDSTSIFR